MHIAFWSPAWPLAKFQNGIITYVHCMKRELQNRGHRVSVFTHVLDPSGYGPDVFLVRRPPAHLWARVWRRLGSPRRRQEFEVFGFSRVIAAAILQLHRSDPIDVIEMEESFGWFADVASRTSIPLVVKLHGPAFLHLMEHELHTPFGREKIEREGQALRQAAIITSPSNFTLLRTVARYALTPKDQRHIENPLTMESETPVWRLDHCARDTLLFVGRFDLCKGADIILQAFLLMLRDRPNLNLIFVGPDRGLPGSGGQRIQFQSYRDMLFPLELRKRVDFRGPLSNHEVSRLRVEAMVTVVASRQENAGYTMLEAMFQGCPLVCTDAGGCPESVIHGVTGLLAKSEVPADFAAQISAMFADPITAAALGDAARRHIISHHSPSRVATAMLEVYEKTVSTPDW